MGKVPMLRKVCTAQRPKPKGAKGKWVHPDTSYFREAIQGNVYKCPHCKSEINHDLP